MVTEKRKLHALAKRTFKNKHPNDLPHVYYLNVAGSAFWVGFLIFFSVFIKFHKIISLGKIPRRKKNWAYLL